MAGTPEWVELYNPTDTAVDIGGWTLDTKSYANDATIPSGESIAPHGFYLIGDLGCGGDHEEAITLTDTDACVRIQDAGGSTVDAVGWGDNCQAGNAEWEGTAYPIDPSSGESPQRKVNDTINEDGYDPAWDTDNNSADFFLQTSPNPQNSSEPPIDPIPEFSTILIPIIGMIALFVIFRRKYKK